MNDQFAIAVFDGGEMAAGSASCGPCDDTATPFSADCFPAAGTDTSDYFAIDL